MDRKPWPIVVASAAATAVVMLTAGIAAADPTVPRPHSSSPSAYGTSHGSPTDKYRDPGRPISNQPAQRASTSRGAAKILSEDDRNAPPESRWIGTASIASANTTFTKADGDLWPSCWAENNSIYSAWGDGKGFDLSSEFTDIGVARIRGSNPAKLKGKNLAVGDDIHQPWDAEGTDRKPTGMVCVGNTLYMAVAERSYGQRRSATIVKSTDGGRTWSYDHRKPMFSHHKFTTVWFADFGRGGRWNTSKYVYAYGIDGNWCGSSVVPSPEDLYLARVPKTKVQKRDQWQFFSGFRPDGVTPTWAKSMAGREPVMHDGRRDIPRAFVDNVDWQNSSVVSQGGVTYDKPLHRYIYTSWSNWEQHFYESKTPWGPWKRMFDHNFTIYDTAPHQYAGYTPTIPSKFLSDDGLTVMVQSNRCCSLPNAHPAYNYSMRPFRMVLHNDAVENPVQDSSVNLAESPETVAVSESSRQGTLAALNNGDVSDDVDDFDGAAKAASWWGYIWPNNRVFNQTTLTTGKPADDGGWFITKPLVEYRRNGTWHTVRVLDQHITPAFKPGKAASDHAVYTVTFPAVVADGVRVIAAPGGDHTYSSVAELDVKWTEEAED